MVKSKHKANQQPCGKMVVMNVLSIGNVYCGAKKEIPCNYSKLLPKKL
jgi:hypothetical protein